MISRMKFTKMHGIGNDYVYVNGFVENVEDPAAVARAISPRHTGIGSDGLILILPSEKADACMRMFNADGSEGEMCGNGIRCVAKYVHDHGISRSNPLKIETGRGVLTLDLNLGGDDKVQRVTVNMGEPVWKPAGVPFDPNQAKPGPDQWTYRIAVGEKGELTDIVPVSTGNPHGVIFVPDVARVDLEKIGPLMERHPAFPRRVNAHWVQVINRHEVKMRTWERGSGITLACGTGAAAVCVASAITDRTSRDILVHLPGGDLTMEWRDTDNCVYMTGPAAEVFTGDWTA